MDPLRLCLALGPVAVYLLLIGAVNLSRRPFLVSGTRDLAALGLAVSGLAVVGPMELFFPTTAAIRFGSYVWVLLTALYALSLVLVLLLLRPRLVVYNATIDQLRPILADLVTELDPGARWAGDSVVLPKLGVHLHLDAWRWMRNVSLVASRSQQSFLGWRRLELALTSALGELEVPRNPGGYLFILAGVPILLLLVLLIGRAPQAVAQALFDLFKA